MRVDAIINSIQLKAQPPNEWKPDISRNKKPAPELKDTVRLFETKNPITNQTTTVGELELIKAIDNASKALEPEYISLEYSRHEGTGTMMLKVLNRDTHEIIREIPPEKILDIVAAIWDMAGIIVDKKV